MAAEVRLTSQENENTKSGMPSHWYVVTLKFVAVLVTLQWQTRCREYHYTKGGRK